MRVLPGCAARVVIIRYGNLTPIIRPAIAPHRVRYPAPRKPDRPSLIVAYNHVYNPVENPPQFRPNWLSKLLMLRIFLFH